jgi:hypothetical protein
MKKAYLHVAGNEQSGFRYAGRPVKLVGVVHRATRNASVRCETGAFAGSRFTMTIWFRGTSTRAARTAGISEATTPRRWIPIKLGSCAVVPGTYQKAPHRRVLQSH